VNVGKVQLAYQEKRGVGKVDRAPVDLGGNWAGGRVVYSDEKGGGRAGNELFLEVEGGCGSWRSPSRITRFYSSQTRLRTRPCPRELQSLANDRQSSDRGYSL
jgi:hypothetical protein